MELSCSTFPMMRDRNGDLRKSRLFTDIMKMMGGDRDRAVDMYQALKGEKFSREILPKCQLDELGEPTLRDVVRNVNFNYFIPEKELAGNLEKELGGAKESADTNANYNRLLSRVRDFNENSPFRDIYVASLQRVGTENGTALKASIRKRAEAKPQEQVREEYNRNLNTWIREYLSQFGIEVGSLTDFERKAGLHGVADFDMARHLGEGLVQLIRIAEGQKGERALPEEFAHLALRALGNSPLVQRLFKAIRENSLQREILGDKYDAYVREYEDNTDKLVEEAAGQLLAKHLLNNEGMPKSKYDGILKRVIEAIKGIFRRMSGDKVKAAMNGLNRQMQKVARDLREGKLSKKMDFSNFDKGGRLFSLQDRVARDRRLLETIISNELKRYQIYEKRAKNQKFANAQKDFIFQLEEKLATENLIDGIYTFLDKALQQLTQLKAKVDSLPSDPDIQETADMLKDIRDYYYSYSTLMDDISAALNQEEKAVGNRYGVRVRQALDQVSILLRDVYSGYREAALELSAKFIQPIISEAKDSPFSRVKRLSDAKEMLKRAAKDISIFDRWLDSINDSSSELLRVLGQIVTRQKEKGRLDALDTIKELEAAHMRAEQAGIKNFGWMFERDSEGNLTGRYIQQVNHGEFQRRRKAMYEELERKYGKRPQGNGLKAYVREKKQWLKDNTTNGEPKLSIYENEVYRNLTDAQRAYYNEVIRIKKRLDRMLPEGYTEVHNTVKIRKDLIERVKQAGSVRGAANAFAQSVKDAFLRRSDDTEFGDKAILKDFEGHEVQMLPVYFTKVRKGESLGDMTEDVTSSMIAYAAMAHDYNAMSKVVSALEVCRDVIRDNLEVQRTLGGRPMVEKLNVLGRKVEGALTKQQEERRIIQRMDDFYSMQVYLRYMKDEGTIGDTGIDFAKTVNALNGLTAVNMLGLNILSGISNVATGKVMMRIESFAGQFFSESDTLKADAIYAQYMPQILTSIGRRVKTDKMSLWMEHFNVLQDYETEAREKDMDRKGMFQRMWNSQYLFAFNNMGEHWMQTRTSLALANRYKMKDRDGNECSLWDAMEVEYIDPSNHDLGAKLVVKEGYTKADGAQFTDEDAIAFSRKSAKVNQRMHGIYNKVDKSAIQALALGRSAMMFRKWIKPSLNRRFKKAMYDYDLGDWSEGYYVTLGHFLTDIYQELRRGEFSLASCFDNLSAEEQANIIRAATELGHFLVLSIFLALMDWDDDDDSWLKNMLEVQARRLYTELGVQTPIAAPGIGFPMASEGLRILKYPATGIKTLEGVGDLLQLLNPMNYMESSELKSGRYKGHTKAYKYFFESPVIPMNKTIYRSLHPETTIPFYKAGN